MPDIAYYLIGVAIGLATSAPAGPVNLTAIQRTFRFGFPAGLFAGLGAVVADSIYASLAAFGITTVSDFIEFHSDLIQTGGGMLVIIFGLKVFTSHPHIEKNGAGETPNILRGLAAGFFMTLTNPGVILGFLAIFGSLGKWAPDHKDYASAALMVAGVASGATLWWMFLAGSVSKLRDRLDDHWLEMINHIAGGLLIAFGLGIYGHLAWQLWQQGA
ncbi:LysE family translocator [Hongsoonwoonella zoysiae]|uniref:LysE family translocator n=1 Tax=Hongsoonwoonella zoysiae TaxID=2821844 RepID=UPI001FE4EF87|nr:LysE family translocator [Hongsoonwoonella zoysiae]